MHFHRPISVILEKQVSASILSGLYSFLSATQPAHPFLHFFFTSSIHPSVLLHHFPRRSLINTPEHWCWPRDPQLESPDLPYGASKPLSQHFHRGLSAEAWTPPSPTPPKVMDWLTSGPKTIGGPSSPHPYGLPLRCPSLDWLALQQHLQVNQFHSFNEDAENSQNLST